MPAIIIRRLTFIFILLTSVVASTVGWATNTASESHTTVIVTFPLGAGVGLEQAKALFESSAPTYKKIPGLVRKYYLYGEGPVGGGVYLWESRANAEKLYTKEWKDNLAKRLGTQPTVTYFYSPVIVDNAK